MNTESNYLCCCEYVDQNNSINHILACCCDCQDFDEGMDSLISGHGFPQQNKSKCLTTCGDRLRVPWIGGARKVSPAWAISLTVIPISLLIATNGVVWTVFSAVGLLSLVTCTRIMTRNCPTNFFQVWIATSFVVLYVVFEMVVIPFLEILLEENVALSIVMFVAWYCFWKAKNMCIQDSFGQFCSYCQKTVPENSSHCLWLGYCIGVYNEKYFVFGLVATVAALLYGCNLALTTVCHPFIWIGSILLPDDCSYVYDLFELALSFVSALYSLGLATFFFIILLHHLMGICLRSICKQRKSEKTAELVA